MKSPCLIHIRQIRENRIQREKVISNQEEEMYCYLKMFLQRRTKPIRIKRLELASMSAFLWRFACANLLTYLKIFSNWWMREWRNALYTCWRRRETSGIEAVRALEPTRNVRELPNQAPVWFSRITRLPPIVQEITTTFPFCSK